MKHTNQLINETSPYLLQHAHNPVNWYPWGEEALNKAKEEDKPILVSIGYAACHWCHVMERESFEDESTAELMNRCFINIKIDREERPDLDHIYMDAVQAMTAAGVQGTNTPDVLTETTADFGFALLMATARRITESEHFLRAGQWKQWSLDLFAGADIHGTTLGILGMGRIGQAIARRAAGFRSRVIYHNRSRLEPGLEQASGATYVDKATLLAESDHLVLVLPFTPQTRHAIGAAELPRNTCVEIEMIVACRKEGPSWEK